MKPFLLTRRRKERGNALVAALLVMMILVMAAAIGAPRGISAMRSAEAIRTRSDEKWEARGRVETGLSYFNEHLRSRFDTDLEQGRMRLRNRVLPAFDSPNVRPELSHPVVVATEGGGSTYSGCESTTNGCTSILGNIDSYLLVRRSLIGDDFFRETELPAGTVGVADMRVVERRTMATGGESAYRIEYIMDARGGQNGRSRDRGEVIFGVNDQSCGTTIGTPVAEQSIPRGQSAIISVSYSRTRTLILTAGAAVMVPTVSNTGFETPVVGAGSFQTGPAGSGWTFSGSAGISGNTSGFTSGNPAAPEGAQVAFIQSSGALTQSVVGWQAGVTYSVSFSAAQRGNCCGGAGQDFQVLVDDQQIGTFRPSGTTYTRLTTNNFTVPAGAHTLKFIGLNSSGGDNTAFIDDVRVAATTQNEIERRTVEDTLDTQAAVFTVTPAADTNYTVTAEGAGSCTAETVHTVHVLAPVCPSIQLFDVSPLTLYGGGQVIVRWQVADAVTVLLNGNPVSAAGTMTVMVNADTTFTLEARDLSGLCPQVQTRQVRVLPCPSLGLFDADRFTITRGETAMLRWRVDNPVPTTSVSLNGALVNPTGTLVVQPDSTTDYTLLVKSPGTACTDISRTIRIVVNNRSCPSITRFEPSVSVIIEGQSIIVFWEVANADPATTQIRLQGGGLNELVAASGSRTLNLLTAGSYRFTLDVTSTLPECSVPQHREFTVSVNPPPPVPCDIAIDSFTGTASCIVAGGTVTYTWTAHSNKPGTLVQINGAGSYPLNGSATFTVNAPQTFTLSVGTNECGFTSQTRSCDVARPAPVISSFTPSNSAPYINEPFDLMWSINGADDATINGTPVDPRGGSMPVSVAATTDFVLVAHTGGCSPQTTQATLRITPRTCPLPVIDYFRPVPPQVAAGGQGTFEWSISSVEAGATVSITGNGINLTGLPVMGTMSFTAPAAVGTYYYTLTAANPCAPARTVSQQVRVDVTCPAPQITSFTINPPSYQAGSRSTINLAWTISDPSGQPLTVSIDRGVGGGFAANGNVDVTAPNSGGTFVYTITATNSCGATASAQATVTVTYGDCAWSARTFYNIPAVNMVGNASNGSDSKWANGYFELTGTTSADGSSANLQVGGFVFPYQTSSGQMFPSRMSVSEARVYNTAGQLVYRGSLSGYIDFTGLPSPGLRIQWSAQPGSGAIEWVEFDWNMQLFRRDGVAGSDSLFGTARFASPCITPIAVMNASTSESFGGGTYTLEDHTYVVQMPSGALVWYFGFVQNTSARSGYYTGTRTLFSTIGNPLLTISRDLGSYGATPSPLRSLCYIPTGTVLGQQPGYATGTDSLRLNPSPTYSYSWDTRFGPNPTTNAANISGNFDSIR